MMTIISFCKSPNRLQLFSQVLNLRYLNLQLPVLHMQLVSQVLNPSQPLEQCLVLSPQFLPCSSFALKTVLYFLEEGLEVDSVNCWSLWDS